LNIEIQGVKNSKTSIFLYDIEQIGSIMNYKKLGMEALQLKDFIERYTELTTTEWVEIKSALMGVISALMKFGTTVLALKYWLW